jgi:hypothetical protein
VKEFLHLLFIPTTLPARLRVIYASDYNLSLLTNGVSYLHPSLYKMPSDNSTEAGNQPKQQEQLDLVAAETEYSGSNGENAERQSKPDETRSKSSPFVFWKTVRPMFQVKKWVIELAIAGFLAWTAYRQVVIAEGLIELTKQQTKIAQRQYESSREDAIGSSKQFEAQHRAWVGIEGMSIDFDRPMVGGRQGPQIGRIAVSSKNYGLTPAKAVIARYCFAISKPDRMPKCGPQRIVKSGDLVPSGERQFTLEFPAETVPPSPDGETFMIVGEISYRDSFGHDASSSFCGYYGKSRILTLCSTHNDVR